MADQRAFVIILCYVTVLLLFRLTSGAASSGDIDVLVTHPSYLSSGNDFDKVRCVKAVTEQSTSGCQCFNKVWSKSRVDINWGRCSAHDLGKSKLYGAQDNLVLSTGLIMWIGHRKEIRKLTFRALALRRSD